LRVPDPGGLLASVFGRYGGYESGQTFVDRLSPAIYGGAGVVFVGALAALAIPRLRRPAKKLDADPAEAIISRCACAGCWGPLVDPHLEAKRGRALLKAEQKPACHRCR
jgi:hypothetical protein